MQHDEPYSDIDGQPLTNYFLFGVVFIKKIINI